MKTAIKKRFSSWQDQKGITIVLVAGLTVMFVAFVALSVDIAHLYAVQNELQAAADAGALAGGRRLYYHDGSSVNTDSNQIAYEAAIANNSDRIAVEVQSPNTNSADVQRGHWSFITRTFTPSDRVTVPNLWNATTEELDADTTFVNAMRVRARRQSTQASSFFARILGFAGFNVAAEAISYIGYAGTVAPLEIDQPIAVCKQAITAYSNTEFSCGTGRMMNANIDTAAWTNFSQPCETANGPTVVPLLCQEPGSNPYSVLIGKPVGTTNGQDNDIYKSIFDCWKDNSSLDTDGDGIADQTWLLTLPVIDCCPEDDPNCDPEVSNCSKIIGVVDVNVMWITEWGNPGPTPRKMEDWTCPSGFSDSQCWAEFAQHFNIKNYDDSYPGFAKKSLYFKPSCSAHVPKGVTGGQNFGVLAKIPVLVK